jgi:hypothetical protein
MRPEKYHSPEGGKGIPVGRCVRTLMSMGDRRHDKPGRWTGEEVEDAAPGKAERAAERAEGNAPISAETAALDEALEEQPVDEQRRTPSGETPEEKTAEAAEEHREAEQDHVRRPPHGKL